MPTFSTEDDFPAPTGYFDTADEQPESASFSPLLPIPSNILATHLIGARSLSSLIPVS